MKNEILTGLILVLVGCLIIMLRNYFAKVIIEAQNRTWGFNFGEKEVVISKIVIIMTGFLFVLFGLLEVGLF